MFEDISNWEHIGFGGMSTLEKEELLSPNEQKFIIKYKRDFEKGTSWEDITEYVAAIIGNLFGLRMMNVQMVTRNSRRGCLLRHFVQQNHAIMAEEGGALLQNLNEYERLQKSEQSGEDLLINGFSFIEEFRYWDIIKEDFIDMLVFDALIGNQDRHPFNWSMLFYDNNHVEFSPIYDNGASLGFRFDDESLLLLLQDQNKKDKYVRKAKVKAGLFEKKQVNASTVINFLKRTYPLEFTKSINKLNQFNEELFQKKVDEIEYLSIVQKDWLKEIIPYRKMKILSWVNEE